MSATLRTALAFVWLIVLIAAGFFIGGHLQVSGDLRKFMPSAETPAQKLLLDELGEGPGSRLLLMSLSGAEAETLAAQSQRIAQTLAADDRFSLVANGGEQALDAIPERLRPYRYLLSNTLDAQPLDEAYLRDELDARVQDLGSPAAALIEPLLPSDPTLETLRIAEALQPANAPQRLHGVWFDKTGREALLAIETRTAGFDPTGQQFAVTAIRNAFDEARGDSGATMILTGPGAFSVEIGGRTQRESAWIGMVDSIGLILLLLIAYRSWRTPLFGVLPLASAGLAGLGAVAIVFADGVHGITVAFGFTLIGVVQDYPIHLFSHQRAGLSPWANARAIWPTLATGVASTCIAYVTFLFSGVDGLQQLAVFTIAGLGVAALTTRLLLPALIDPAPRGFEHGDIATSPRLATLWKAVARVPRPRAWQLASLAALTIAIVAFAPGAFWQNDLSKLTPVPADALAQDAHLRDALGAPDVRYLLAVRGADAEQALQRVEALHPKLDGLIARKAIAGYDSAARVLPSAATQRARQSELPVPETLRASLDAAVAATPFRSDAFEDFVADIERARTAAPLTPRDLAGTPLATRIGGLLLENSDHATALVSMTGLTDPAAVARALTAPGVELLDLKTASESLVEAYRERVLLALAIAALLLAATVWLALRSPHRALRVLLPMALTTMIVLAVLRAFGVELTLFHLVALILAAGLGLDYALFFEHAGDDYEDQLRTLHALIVCSLMTLLVFFLLALSSIPVLRAIGVTVTLGVIGNFVLALLIARHSTTPAVGGPSGPIPARIAAEAAPTGQVS
jgi:predicted exporter